jgi:glycosyltransferase involved in cell wall biosynthesis
MLSLGRLDQVSSRITILTGIFPPDIGGPATSVPELAAELERQGREVAVVALANDPSADHALPEPYDVIRVARRLPRLRRAAEVVRAVRRTNADVVLANGLHIESAFLAGLPVVQKIVGDWAWERSQNNGWSLVEVERFQVARLPPKARAVRLLRTKTTRRARLVIVPSRYVGRLVTAWGFPGARIRVVPNAAPRPAASSMARLPRVLFAGRLVRWKHVDHVIRVLPALPDLTLDVIGTGPELSNLRALSGSLRLENRVVFHGALPKDEVVARMAQSACLVLPSSYEGMPHVVLEAFSRGLPVVASDRGGTPEIVENEVSGLLYRWGRLPALREALRTVTDPPVANRLAEGGAAVATRLTVETSALETVRVLTEAVTDGRSG